MILLKTDGTSEDMPLQMDLESLQQLVEGYIEFYGFADGSALIVNEEGRLRGMAANAAATSIATLKHRPENILGPALFLSKSELDKFKEYDAPR